MNEPFHKINQIEAVQHQKHNLPQVSPVMTYPFSLSHTMLQESHQPQSGSCSPSPAVWGEEHMALLTYKASSHGQTVSELAPTLNG
jgi:hypothetical protein